MPLKLQLGLGILPTPPPPPPRSTTLVCDLLNAVALNGDEITLLVKSNRATATNTDISCDISLMTQNEQNSIDLYNFSYYSSVIKCRSLLAPTTFILQTNLTWLKFYSYPTITAKKAVKKKRSVYYSFSALSSQVTTDIGFLPVAFCWVLLCLFAISLAMTPTPVLFPVRMNYYWVQKLISSNSLSHGSVDLWEIL